MPTDVECKNASSPQYKKRVAAQAAREKQVFSFAVPANTFADVSNGDVRTYSALAVNTAGTIQALPNWVTRTFSGMPGSSADGGSFDFQVTETDRSGPSVFSGTYMDSAVTPTSRNFAGWRR